MNDRQRRGLRHIATLLAIIPIAYAVGLATHSVRAFEVTMMVGLVAHLALRIRRTR